MGLPARAAGGGATGLLWLLLECESKSTGLLDWDCVPWDAGGAVVLVWGGG